MNKNFEVVKFLVYHIFSQIVEVYLSSYVQLIFSLDMFSCIGFAVPGMILVTSRNSFHKYATNLLAIVEIAVNSKYKLLNCEHCIVV